MKSIKRILAKIMVIAMLLTLMPITQNVRNVKAVTFEITAPKANKLVGAGHFDIKWTNASGSVKSYKVYLDGKLQGSTSNTSYECYTTEVAIHKAFVVAELNNGSTEKTNTIDFKVTKKGLCVNDEMGRNLNPVFMNMGWYYTWGTTPFTYTTYDQLEFVPMIWGTGSENNISSIASAGYKHLLAYNEPDMDWTVGGSNIDVNTAVSHWSNFTSYNSYYLGAPAPALSPSWDSGTWFRTFMDRIDTSTIDFIPLHCYYGQYGGSAGANAFLTDVVDKTWNMYHKPIWITEFAVSGWGYSNESAKASMKEFMTTVIDGLNKRDYVERYSWFSFNTTDEANGASALWTNSTGELTELGRVYSEYGNPTQYANQEQESETQRPTEGQTESESQKPTGNFTFFQDIKNILLENVINIDGKVCEDYINKSGVSVSATSKQGDNSAEKAVDSDINSRWESVHGADPQSFLIDLGKVKAVRQIDIIWEAASAKTYSIDLSEDGINYTSEATVNSDNSNQNRYDSIKLNNARNARYVRINCIARTTGYGYSIFDLAIYGITESTEQTTSEPDTTNEGNDKNIAENKTAVSSGDEGENVAAKYAVDGNKGTRWSSDFDNNAWMYVDFGKEYKVSKVILIWESAYGKSYDIQISNDGVNWTTVKEMRGQDGGEDIIEFNAVTARYLKLQGIERATGYGYSLWEMEVYGENSVSGEETNNPAVSGQNVAVNKNVIQSGSESSSMAADKAVDGNTNTRWSSDFNDNAWMYVDLGNTYAVNKINILWENAYGKEYDIQVSNDGINWITVKEMRNQDGGEDVVEFNTVNARYVKFQGVKRAIGYGYSMWEFEVLAK